MDGRAASAEHAPLNIVDFAHVMLLDMNSKEFQEMKGVVLAHKIGDIYGDKVAVELENSMCIAIDEDKLMPIDPMGEFGCAICEKGHRMIRIRDAGGLHCEDCLKMPLKHTGDFYVCAECKNARCMECALKRKLNICPKGPLKIMRNRDELKAVDRKYGGGYMCESCHINKFTYPMWHCTGKNGESDWNACAECIPEKTHGFRENFEYPEDLIDTLAAPKPPAGRGEGRGSGGPPSGMGRGRGGMPGGMGPGGPPGGMEDIIALLETMADNPEMFRQGLSDPGFQQMIESTPENFRQYFRSPESLKAFVQLLKQQGPGGMGGPGMGRGGMPGMGRGGMPGMGRGGMPSMGRGGMPGMGRGGMPGGGMGMPGGMGGPRPGPPGGANAPPARAPRLDDDDDEYDIYS